LQALLPAVLVGAVGDGLDEVVVVARAALGAGPADVLGADGYILGTPANLGYMSGALKHFFDTLYYPCLEETVGRPYAMYLHGESDTEGARLAIEKIATGLRWRPAQEPVSCLGPPGARDRSSCWELGAATAAGLLL
jgi:hypothetical protein